MQVKTFKDKVAFFFRKIAISLKRNYYIIPLIFVAICCVQFMCRLNITSENFNRVDKAFGEYSCLFIFVISLLSILACVAYLNYALISYGGKRPLFMLIIYYVMWAIIIALMIMLINANNLNIADEWKKYNEKVVNDPINAKENLNYYNLGNQTNKILIVHLVLEIVAFVVVTTAPLVQAALKKLKFKKVDSYE